MSETHTKFYGGKHRIGGTKEPLVTLNDIYFKGKSRAVHCLITSQAMKVYGG